MSDTDDSSFESADEGIDVDDHHSNDSARNCGLECDDEEASGSCLTTKQTSDILAKVDLLQDTSQSCVNRKAVGEIEESQRTTEDVEEIDTKDGWDVDDDILNETVEVHRDITADTEQKSESNKSVEEPPVGASGECVSSSPQYLVPTRDTVTPTRKLESKVAQVDKEKSVLDKLSESSQTQSSWGWGSWGSSILSTATASVSTLTNQFGQGLTTVLETVESTIGAPSPEELAEEQMSKLCRETSEMKLNETGNSLNANERQDSDQQSSVIESSIDSLVSGVTSLKSAIESKVITSGLDTLELIGRKTMDMLQEGDPGLKKKRDFLRGNKQNLSETLREAKNKAEECSSVENNEGGIDQIHFGTVFDDSHGFVHLEALEMLSKQCEQKVHFALLDLTGEMLQNMQKKLSHIEECCTLKCVDDTDTESDKVIDFVQLVSSHLAKCKIQVNVDTLNKIHLETETWINTCTAEQETGKAKEASLIFREAIQFFGQFTAKVIELLHKACELIMVSSECDIDKVATHLTEFGNACCTNITIQSSGFSSCLNTAADDSENPDLVTPLITNVYLEASNSNTYIHNAFELIVPIIQLKYMQEN